MAVVRQCSACVSCVASCGLRAGSLLLQWRLRLRTAVFLFVALWRRSRSRCPVHRPWTRRRSATRQRCLLARAWWMPSVMTLCALPWPQAVPNRAMRAAPQPAVNVIMREVSSCSCSSCFRAWPLLCIITRVLASPHPCQAHPAAAASFLGTRAAEPFFPAGSDDLLPVHGAPLVVAR